MQNRTTSALVCKHILQEIIKGQGPYSLQGPCLCLPVSRPAGLLRARVPCLQPTMPTLTSTTWTHLPRYPTPLTPILPCASPPPLGPGLLPICPSTQPVHLYTLLPPAYTQTHSHSLSHTRSHTIPPSSSAFCPVDFGYSLNFVQESDVTFQISPLH